MAYKESCELGGITACRPCGLEGKSYSHGSRVLKDDLAMRCVNGKWRGRVIPSSITGPRETYKVKKPCFDLPAHLAVLKFDKRPPSSSPGREVKSNTAGWLQ